MSIMPNFFIVGAARSGTTSFDRYLSQHPEIYLTPRKEVHFFAAEHFPCHGPGDDGLNQKVIRDEHEYSQLFTGATTAKAIGESSVFYLCLPGTAERIAQAVPNAKILMLLREPVERAYSAYMLLMRDGRETGDFAEGLRREQERKQQGFEPMWWYKELSSYYNQVKRYLDIFGKERVKVLLYDELSANPEQVLREVFAFLEVKENVAINTSVRHNVAGLPKSRPIYTFLDNFITKPNALEKRIKSLIPVYLRQKWANRAMGALLRSTTMDSKIYIELKAHFEEDVGKLEELLQRDLQCWHPSEGSLSRHQVVQGTT